MVEPPPEGPDLSPTDTVKLNAGGGVPVAIDAQPLFKEAKALGEKSNIIEEYSESGRRTVNLRGDGLSGLLSARQLVKVVGDWADVCRARTGEVREDSGFIRDQGVRYRDIDQDGALSMVEKKLQDDARLKGV